MAIATETAKSFLQLLNNIHHYVVFNIVSNNKFNDVSLKSHLVEINLITNKFQRNMIELKNVGMLKGFTTDHNIDTIINNMDVCIHFKISDLDYYMTSDYYKNRFEIEKSDPFYLGYRFTKEYKLFSYPPDNDNFCAKFRPRYGNLHCMDSKYNNRSSVCSSYGGCYFVLKKKYHYRCTLTCGNSEGDKKIYSMRYPSQILHNVSSYKLIKSNKNPCGYYINAYNYIEVQMHFIPYFNEAFEAMYIPVMYKDTDVIHEKIKGFCSKNNIKLIWVEPDA